MTTTTMRMTVLASDGSGCDGDGDDDVDDGKGVSRQTRSWTAGFFVSNGRSCFRKKRRRNDDSLVIIWEIFDREQVPRVSSFRVILFHRLLGNFSGMFWGSSR